MAPLARLLLAATAVMVGGCANVHLSQKPGTAIERTATETKEDIPDGVVAARVLPYALLAQEAYAPQMYGEKPPARVLENYCNGSETHCLEEADANFILSKWKMIYAQDVGGLGTQIWVSTGDICREAVIAFRGTERKRLINWVSNFHWFTRPLPVTDQYERVDKYIDDYLDIISKAKCYRAKETTIIAVGHSLGAGLAQHATYAQQRSPTLISRVYGFDSTFVTGSRDFDLEDIRKRSEGIIIERIYEHGEILAFPHFVLRHVNVPWECSPRIVSIRFDLLPWQTGLVGQHSLRTFTSGLLREADEQPPGNDALAMESCTYDSQRSSSVE